jgi:hypothetical protein
MKLAEMIQLKTFADERGALTVIDKVLPFEIKRVYYIYNTKASRGGHKHRKNRQALISVAGSCRINVRTESGMKPYLLDSPEKCLIIEAGDWHTMDDFAKGTVLLVLASEHFDASDYVCEGTK